MLSDPIKQRLNEATFLDLMTHMSGLSDKSTNHKSAILSALLEHTPIPNPIEPDDFLQYASDKIKTIHKFNYSGLGIIIASLYAKHLYNKKHNTKLSYNEILHKYIIHKAKLNSFSIKMPSENVLYNINDKVAPYLNGSPSGGYWISCNDLLKFGEFILNKCRTDADLYELVKKYGTEFYKNGKMEHFGGIGSASTLFSVDITANTIVCIMDNHNSDAHLLWYAMNIY